MEEENQNGPPPFEAFGNRDTMNLHNILYHNIIASPYFKSLYEKKTYNKVIEEIQIQVSSLVPFFKDTYASTAFCLLYKLWTLKLNTKQIQILLMYPDSPYVRALGFLYLRYVCKPSLLWSWFCDWLDDEEKIQLDDKISPKITTIGNLCRMLLTELKWLGTILPRIPIPIAREISSKLKELDDNKLHQSKKKNSDGSNSRKISHRSNSLEDENIHEGSSRKHRSSRSHSHRYRSPDYDYVRRRDYVRSHNTENDSRDVYDRNHDKRVYSRSHDRKRYNSSYDRKEIDRRYRESPSRKYRESPDYLSRLSVSSTYSPE